jgi:hypothetical protein
MILSNISVPHLGMVDTGVTGHLESPIYLGAVAIGGTIFGFLYTGMNFLRMGTTGITAQSLGAEDNDGLRVSLGQALIVSLLIALALIAVQHPVGTFAMRLIGAEPDVESFALLYFSIRIWSAPGTLANFVLIGWFLGLQNARVPLIIFLVINITNIVLDLLFVIVLGLKVDGVALASVIAEYTGLAVCACLRGVLFDKRTPVYSHDGLDVHIRVRYGTGRALGRPRTRGQCRTDEPSKPDRLRSRRHRPCCRGTRRQSCRPETSRCTRAVGTAFAKVVAVLCSRVLHRLCDHRAGTGKAADRSARGSADGASVSAMAHRVTGDIRLVVPV